MKKTEKMKEKKIKENNFAAAAITTTAAIAKPRSKSCQGQLKFRLRRVSVYIRCIYYAPLLLICQ